jgi:hypothetical protein
VQQYGEITSAACQACTAACTVMGGQLQLQVARRSRGSETSVTLAWCSRTKGSGRRLGVVTGQLRSIGGGDGAKLALALPSVTSSCSFLDLE